MENLVQPTVFITPAGQNYKPPKNRKPLILVIIAILIIGGLGFAGYYYRVPLQKNLQALNIDVNKILAPAVKKPKASPQIIKQGKVSDLVAKDHPSLFYVDLEYDPKTGITTQFQVGTTNGDPIRFFSDPPAPSSNKFIYKVEVLTKTNQISESGWGEEYKEIVQTKDGKYSFRISVYYKPETIIRVYLPNKKLIWTGRMPKDTK